MVKGRSPVQGPHKLFWNAFKSDFSRYNFSFSFSTIINSIWITHNGVFTEGVSLSKCPLHRASVSSSLVGWSELTGHDDTNCVFYPRISFTTIARLSHSITITYFCNSKTTGTNSSFPLFPNSREGSLEVYFFINSFDLGREISNIEKHSPECSHSPAINSINLSFCWPFIVAPTRTIPLMQSNHL